MKIRNHLITALLAAVLCVLAPWALPTGAVPVTLATLGVYLTAGFLGPVRGCAAVGLYLGLGALGVPVFAGFTGGVQQCVAPTAGFLWGYLPCVLVAGALCRVGTPKLTPLWLACGTVVLYAVGCGWFAWQTDVPLWTAAVTCAIPCLPGEIVKITVATGVILSLRGRMRQLVTAGVKEQRL